MYFKDPKEPGNEAGASEEPPAKKARKASGVTKEHATVKAHV